MPKFLDMLRQRNVFGPPGRPNNAFGMPDIDDGNVAAMFRQVVPLARSLKDDDARRQREMMEFQSSLARREQANQPQVRPVAPSKPNVVFGGTHPLTSMQQRFRDEDDAKTEQKNRLAQIGATQTGALNNALATGRQRDDADMARTVAEINGRAGVAKDNRASVERAADDARTDKAKTDEIARTQKGPLVNVPHPVTGKMESRQYNPATRKYEGITIDDSQAGTSYKQGTIPKPAVNPGQDPERLKAARTTAQDIINDLDKLLDDKGNLQQHTADAVGKSRMLGNVSSYFGAGSLTPSTTKGRAGIDQVKNKLVLEQIGKLKRQSRTGATGFGQMNMKELALLENAASKLNSTDMDDNTYKDELNSIRMALQKVLLDSTEDDSGGGDRTDELIRKYGG